MTARQRHPDLGEERLANLVQKHQVVLMAHVMPLTNGDHGWAEDVVQETFIRAWHHLERMTEEHGSVRSWLMRVAHNLAMDGHRARRARPFEVEEVESKLEPIGDASAEVLASIGMDRALESLPHRQRVVVEEVYVRDRTLADAAHRLGIPVGTAKSRVFYALRDLRASLALQPCVAD